MKKLKKSIFTKLPPVRLFLDDIEAIEQIYKDNCESFKIETEGFELSSSEEFFSEEFKKLDLQKISYLNFYSNNPYITVELISDETHIYSGDDDAQSTGIVNKIKDILEKRFAPLRYLGSWQAFLISFGLNSIAVFLAFFKESYEYKGINIVIILMVIISLLCFISFWLLKYSSVAYLRKKDLNNNFFLKNKEQIGLLVIGGLITFLVQLVVQLVRIWIEREIPGAN